MSLRYVDEEYKNSICDLHSPIFNYEKGLTYAANMHITCHRKIVGHTINDVSLCVIAAVAVEGLVTTFITADYETEEIIHAHDMKILQTIGATLPISMRIPKEYLNEWSFINHKAVMESLNIKEEKQRYRNRILNLEEE